MNWANPKVRDEVFRMMTWWCEKGIDGFRMDVIGMIGKENYDDGPVAPGALYGSFGPSCMHTETTHRYLREMRRRVLDKFDLLTVGEAGGGTADAIRYSGSDGSELNMTFGFEHTDDINDHTELGKWSDHGSPLAEVREVLNRWQMDLIGKAWGTAYMSNHDQPRQVSRFGNDSPQWREKSAQMLGTLLHMMRGTVFVYQGEELGMTNIYFRTLDEYKDVEVFNAWKQWVDSGRVHPQDMLRWYGKISRDNARTPMQWDATANAGFTTGTPWIAVNPNYVAVNAEAERRDPNSVFNYYKKLIALRHTHPIIVYGDFVPLLTDDPQVYAYRRELDGEELTVLCNWTDRNAPCALSAEETGEELISNYPDHKPGFLFPYEARVFLKKRG